MGLIYLESQADLAGHQFLHGSQHDGVADLLPLTVPLNLSIQGRRFPGLRMGIIWTHCVNLRCSETPHNTHKHRKCLRDADDNDFYISLTQHLYASAGA